MGRMPVNTTIFPPGRQNAFGTSFCTSDACHRNSRERSSNTGISRLATPTTMSCSGPESIVRDSLSTRR